jgi:TRAP-type C4-dicarboxylate transport system substrate-binding protein
VPELGLFSVSYLFRNGEHFNRVVSDPAFRARVEELIDSKDLGLKFLGFYSAGVRNIYTRKGPIETPGDLKGVKLRVMNNPVEAEIWSTLEAIPTPMNFGEVYQALLSGVLDAAENAPSVIESNRHFEAANTLVLTEHQRSVALLLMSKARFDALTEAQKTALIEASEIATKAERVRDAELNSEAVARMEKAGVKVVKPDTAKFAEKVNDIQNKVAADLGVKDVLAIIQSHAE